MARAIDADALQELCNRRIQDTWNSKVAPVSWAEAYADFKDDIDSIPTLTPPNEWVSVEEKTPKGNASILIYENGDIAIATFKDEKFMEYSDTGYPVLIRRPTHWTPLPEPPEEDE